MVLTDLTAARARTLTAIPVLPAESTYLHLFTDHQGLLTDHRVASEAAVYSEAALLQDRVLLLQEPASEAVLHRVRVLLPQEAVSAEAPEAVPEAAWAAEAEA